jgi:7-cyano-7-deazaguanine synthase in queuosine biosynthesis
MSRIILFSGGVESTALLANARGGDFALTVFDHTPGGDTTARLTWCEEIAAKLEVPLKTASVSVSRARNYASEGHIHQLWWLLSAVNLWIAHDRRVTSVLYGLESTPLNDMSADVLSRVRPALRTLHGVDIEAPFRHLSKEEQWGMIPAEVRPLVRNCTFSSDCGRCAKCKQLKALPGSFWCEVA